MNKPYVKQYNELGELLNPIQGSYINFFPNRQQRRAYLRKTRKYPNKKDNKLMRTQRINVSGKIYKYIKHFKTKV